MQWFDDEFKRQMLLLIREGTQDIRADVAIMRNVLGNVDVRLKAVQSDVNSLKRVCAPKAKKRYA